ncbi:MAG: hypothetical protein R3F59_30975 [Myxococcota bacterium]
MVWWMAWTAAAAEPAGPTLAHWFPEERLTAAQVSELLAEADPGPPARTYDHTTRTLDLGSPVEVQVEHDALGARADALAAPDALRCYARLTLPLYRNGQLEPLHAALLGEHCGLARPASLVGEFVAGTPEQVADQVRTLTAAWVDDPELRAVAVALGSSDDAPYVGVVTALFGALAFEPFPRVAAPGSVVRIPGTFLEDDGDYSLFVTTPAPRCASTRSTATGPSTSSSPSPTRRARSRWRCRRPSAASSARPFSFTVFVGTDPQPPELPAFGLELGHPPADVERAVLDALNTERARFGLAPLQAAGDPQRMRDLLANLPDNERAAWRYLRREMRRTEPDRPHGLWRNSAVFGVPSAEGAAWVLLRHPVFRLATLGATAERVVIGAREEDGALQVALVTIEAPQDAADAGDQVRAALAAQWPLGAPARRPSCRRRWRCWPAGSRAARSSRRR